MTTIYGLIDPRTGCLRYVGLTANVAKRLFRHCHPLNDDRSHRGCWLRGVVNLGLRPELVVLEHVADRVRALDLERFWISSLRAAGADLVNVADGGDGGATRTGARLTNEHKNKIRMSHFGIRPSREALENMKWTPERRANMAASVRRRNPRAITHGTYNGYYNGCRCTHCLDALRRSLLRQRRG